MYIVHLQSSIQKHYIRVSLLDFATYKIELQQLQLQAIQDWEEMEPVRFLYYSYFNSQIRMTEVLKLYVKTM